MARSEIFPDVGNLDGSDFNDLGNAVGNYAVVDAISAALTDTKNEAWPDPAPLPNALPPVAAFDVELLPEALRGWVSDIAHRMQCPPDFTAVGAITALSSPDISPQSVETGTALPLKCPNIEVSNLDERAGNAETKLYSTTSRR